jgi:hypothetical protein
MNLDLYCKYARNNSIKCSLSELMIECNKHYIVKVIQTELEPLSVKCASFDINYSSNNIMLSLIDSCSLQKVSYVIVDLKYLYDPCLFNYSVKNNTFAYLIYND